MKKILIKLYMKSRLHLNSYMSYGGSFSRWGGLNANYFYFVSQPVRKHLKPNIDYIDYEKLLINSQKTNNKSIKYYKSKNKNSSNMNNDSNFEFNFEID